MGSSLNFFQKTIVKQEWGWLEYITARQTILLPNPDTLQLCRLLILSSCFLEEYA